MRTKCSENERAKLSTTDQLAQVPRLPWSIYADFFSYQIVGDVSEATRQITTIEEKQSLVTLDVRCSLHRKSYCMPCRRARVMRLRNVNWRNCEESSQGSTRCGIRAQEAVYRLLCPYFYGPMVPHAQSSACSQARVDAERGLYTATHQLALSEVLCSQSDIP